MGGGAVSFERGTPIVHSAPTLQLGSAPTLQLSNYFAVQEYPVRDLRNMSCGEPLSNMACISQSRPDSGICFQIKVLKTFRVFPLPSEAVKA
jgi:hypothetical protein